MHFRVPLASVKNNHVDWLVFLALTLPIAYLSDSICEGPNLRVEVLVCIKHFTPTMCAERGSAIEFRGNRSPNAMGASLRFPVSGYKCSAAASESVRNVSLLRRCCKDVRARHVIIMQ